MNVDFDERAICDRCGKFGAYIFETEKLCVDCYETRASCCAEFGGDDLTTNGRPSGDTHGVTENFPTSEGTK